MPRTKPIVSIENVVASATIDQKLDLEEIQKKFPDVEYNPESFLGAVFRLKLPKTATLLFVLCRITPHNMTIGSIFFCQTCIWISCFVATKHGVESP